MKRLIVDLAEPVIDEDGHVMSYAELNEDRQHWIKQYQSANSKACEALATRNRLQKELENLRKANAALHQNLQQAESDNQFLRSELHRFKQWFYTGETKVGSLTAQLINEQTRHENLYQALQSVYDLAEEWLLKIDSDRFSAREMPIPPIPDPAAITLATQAVNEEPANV